MDINAQRLDSPGCPVANHVPGALEGGFLIMIRRLVLGVAAAALITGPVLAQTAQQNQQNQQPSGPARAQQPAQQPQAPARAPAQAQPAQAQPAQAPARTTAPAASTQQAPVGKRININTATRRRTRPTQGHRPGARRQDHRGAPEAAVPAISMISCSATCCRAMSRPTSATRSASERLHDKRTGPRRGPVTLTAC